MIYDTFNNQPIVVILANDNTSFVVLERTSKNQKFTLTGTTLNDGMNKFTFLGSPENPVVKPLKQVSAYQEYWHSWKTFHPETLK